MWHPLKPGSSTCRAAIVWILVVEMALAVTPPTPTDSRSEARSVRAESSKLTEESQRAVDSTRLLLGVGVGGNVAVDGPPTEVVEDHTPYLSNRVVGKLVWNIIAVDFRLILPSFPFGLSNPNITRLEIQVDANSGQVYRIRSSWTTVGPSIPPEPSAESATEQMSRNGNEVYHEFPSEPARCSFIEALDAVSRGGGDLLITKQVSAVYVMWSRIGRFQEPRAVWAITLRGIPPVKPPPGAPKSGVDSFRYIIDATSCALLCGSNIPRPDKPPSQE